MSKAQTAIECVTSLFVRDGLRIISKALVGSAYINDKETSDFDVLVLADLGLEDQHFQGWTYGGSSPKSGDQWCSWKKTTLHEYPPEENTTGERIEVNLLLTNSPEYFNAWVTAAEVCRLLHLQGTAVSKSIRIGIHDIIMDDMGAGEVSERIKNTPQILAIGS